MTTLQHPKLGEIRGVIKGSTRGFHGIKYASLKDRFAEPELISDYDGKIDATEYGPHVTSPASGCDREFALIQQSLPKPEFTFSDLDGLSINVTVPNDSQASPQGGNGFPVFVFIHGGGFAIGSSGWPQFDMSRFVSFSGENGTPLIAVTMNYRLGVPGFLTSQELRDAGYKSNNGLRDQRTALQWIKQNIAGFGGDPDNVTVAGESAGAASAWYHLHSKQPLFKRLILLSGSGLLSPPLAPPVIEFAYSSVTKALGLDGLSPEERVKAIVNLPADELLAKTPRVPLLPALDGDVIPVETSFDKVSKLAESTAEFPGIEWCEDLLVGACQFDGSVMSVLIPNAATSTPSTLYDRFTKATTTTLPASASTTTTSLLTTYNPSATKHPLLHFATDLLFHAPVHFIATAWPRPTRSFAYFFNEPNPWDGPFKGYATHVLDVAFLFLNFEACFGEGDDAEREAERRKAVGRGFAGDLGGFCYGRGVGGCWEEGKVRVYGGFGEGGVVRDVGKGEVGRGVFEFGEAVGFDVLMKVWGGIMRGD
ncbi:hypothetical protein FQN52_003243 [Onygenales sp. PD_12]|nr:hypothetical protein FQN52_003243 [Onygenales sp. PD_12]